MDNNSEYQLILIPIFQHICTFQVFCAVFSLLLRCGGAFLLFSSDTNNPEDDALQYLRALLIVVLDLMLLSNGLFGNKLIRKICSREEYTLAEVFLQSRTFAMIAAVNILLCLVHVASFLAYMIPAIITIFALHVKAISVVRDQVDWLHTVTGREQLDDTELALNVLYSLLIAVLCGKAAKICLRNAVILRERHSRQNHFADQCDLKELIFNGNFPQKPPPSYSEHDPAQPPALI